jgi:hypothetical protein
LVVALIFLLVGLAFLAASSVSVTSFNETKLEYKEKSLEISGLFNRGEKIIVKFWPNEKWNDASFDPPIPEIEYPHLFLYFTIMGPLNVNASFEVAVVRFEFNTTPYVYQILVLDTGSLTVPTGSNKTTEIGGIVNHSGNYTTIFEGAFGGGPLSPETALPESLTLYKGVPETSSPYTFLLPIGVAMVPFGLVLLIWSVRTSKRAIRHKHADKSKH